jgi:hydrogenase expression/formation protein HypE
MIGQEVSVYSALEDLRHLRESQIVLAHGGGGQLTDELVAHTIVPRLDNSVLSDLLDAGIFNVGDARLAMTVDGYVVQPLVFPGGDIGRLAVSGTVNDLAVSGAEPLAIALGLILAEGLDKRVMEDVLDSIRATADEAGVLVITGDTKVVGRGQADGMYVTTSGIGRVPAGRRLHPDRAKPGDVILLSGTIADHGLAVMLAREMPTVQSVLASDVAPLNRMIAGLLRAVPDVVFMRDPTRGGLAAVAADLAARTGYRVVLDESSIPVREETRHAAEMLGLDPLEVANEGKVVVVVRASDADAALAALRDHPLGVDARRIGYVAAERDGLCELMTEIGGRRILQKPYGEQLPRIC